MIQAWFDLLRAVVQLARKALRAFWLEPGLMLGASLHHLAGDRDGARVRVQKIMQRHPGW